MRGGTLETSVISCPFHSLPDKAPAPQSASFAHPPPGPPQLPSGAGRLAPPPFGRASNRPAGPAVGGARTAGGTRSVAQQHAARPPPPAFGPWPGPSELWTPPPRPPRVSAPRNQRQGIFGLGTQTQVEQPHLSGRWRHWSPRASELKALDGLILPSLVNCFLGTRVPPTFNEWCWATKLRAFLKKQKKDNIICLHFRGGGADRRDPCFPPRTQFPRRILKSKAWDSGEFLLKYRVRPYSEFLMSKRKKVIPSNNWHYLLTLNRNLFYEPSERHSHMHQ